MLSIFNATQDTFFGDETKRMKFYLVDFVWWISNFFSYSKFRPLETMTGLPFHGSAQGSPSTGDQNAYVSMDLAKNWNYLPVFTSAAPLLLRQSVFVLFGLISLSYQNIIL